MDASDVTDDGWVAMTGQGFVDEIGPMLTRQTPDGPRFAMRVEERHLNPFGIMHGGAIMTFLDHAIGITGARTHDAPGQATITLTVAFVDGVPAGVLLEADVEVVRTTRSVIFLRGAARVGEKVVATADGVWKIRRPR
ncbi:PaaI family thioesterase [Acuticoccus sp. I52.16.1]|uniref:PaaI family thioesterase n=1 Tax=Acuticoccus sp. I52.16.1 TaxID=2928472 RepID=UPI001FD01D59|nr:PaaI family thioesterase [Acuticoccus sp. I52.16.1]UOM33261.1 PaaI family thioesterase [Acuticoccus sp. I52.16.1]